MGTTYLENYLSVAGTEDQFPTFSIFAKGKSFCFVVLGGRGGVAAGRI